MVVLVGAPAGAAACDAANGCTVFAGLWGCVAFEVVERAVGPFELDDDSLVVVVVVTVVVVVVVVVVVDDLLVSL